jgi:NADH-quinone oxidoreductase subunit N
MNEMPETRDGEDTDAAQNTTDFQLLFRRSPFLAWMLATGLGSLAGIPPTIGFVAKFLVIVAAFSAGLWWLSGIALLCVGAGVFYYFGWLREAFQRIWLPEERLAEISAPVQVAWQSRLALLALSSALLLGGTAPWLTQFVAKW